MLQRSKYEFSIGPSFFDSYNAYPDVKWVAGLNVGNQTAGSTENWAAAVGYACSRVGDVVEAWEFGNEPNLFRNMPKDPGNYVRYWVEKTKAAQAEMDKNCPGMKMNMMAPSFAGTNRDAFNETVVMKLGLNQLNNIGILSSHK